MVALLYEDQKYFCTLILDGNLPENEQLPLLVGGWKQPNHLGWVHSYVSNLVIGYFYAE